MLTDEELTTRLSAVFHDGVPELTYAGPVPRVRGPRAGLAAPSVMAATAALVLVPSALQHDSGRTPDAVPGTGGPGTVSKHAVHTLDIAGLHLSDASVGGRPGPLYAAVGPHLTIPPDAEKVDVGLPVDVYLAKNPAGGEPQVYVESRSCPDTNDPCPTPPPTHVYGILAPGWTRQQLLDFLEHPVRAYESARRHAYR